MGMMGVGGQCRYFDNIKYNIHHNITRDQHTGRAIVRDGKSHVTDAVDEALLK